MENGQKYGFDQVVVTVNIGVLQKNLIEFDPILPKWKTKSINELKVAHFCKIFLKFETRFWTEGLRSFKILTS